MGAPLSEKVFAEHRLGVVVAVGQKSPARHAAQLPGPAWPVLGLYVPALQLVGLTDWRGQ